MNMQMRRVSTSAAHTAAGHAPVRDCGAIQVGHRRVFSTDLDSNRPEVVDSALNI
jgi:hypothetical protein